MRTRLLTFWLPAAVLLVITAIAWTRTGGPDTLTQTSASARGFLQSLGLLAFALALISSVLASRRPHLWNTLGLVVLGGTLQVASAFADPVAPLTFTSSTRALLTGAAISLICLPLIVLLAHAALPPAEPAPPLRMRLRATLRQAARLGPVMLLFGPIFQKEVRVTGRHRSTYLARALYPLALIGVAALAYAGMTLEISEDRGAERLEQLQRFAPILALAVGWCQFMVLLFIAPLMAAPAICEERRALTMPALMTTPLTSAQIIFGKLSSRVVQLIILTLVATPLLLAIRIFGGLEARIIIATTSVTLSAAILAASLGLMYSVWHRRAATAALFAMLSMGVFVLIVAVLLIITSLRSTLPPSNAWIFGLSALTSMFAIHFAVVDPWPGADDPTFITQVWVINTAVNLTLSFLVCGFATLALRRAARAELTGSLVEREIRRARRRRGRAANAANGEAVEPETQPQRSKEAESAARCVGDRPVLWREVRQSTLGSRRRLLLLTAAIALGLGWLYARVGLHDEITHFAVAIIGVLVLILQAALAATASIPAEREQRTWEVLMTTPLRGSEILTGKFLGALRRQWMAPTWMLGHFVLAAAIGAIHPAFLLHLVMLIAGTSVLLTGTGLLLGSVLRRSTAAAVCNIALALLLWAGFPIGLSITHEILYAFRNELERAFDAAIVINPFAIAVIALEPAVNHADTPLRHLSYRLEHSPIPFGTFTMTLAITAGAGALAGLASLFATIRLFPRLSGRSS